MIIPPILPPRAPAIQAQVKEAAQTVADIQSALRALALDKVEAKPGASKAYGDCEAALVAAKADLETKSAALVTATKLDSDAAASRLELIRNSDPAELIEGITQTGCCSGCSASECLLAGGRPFCLHPNKGQMPPSLMLDPVIGKLRSAARAEIEAQLRGDPDDDEEFDEDEDDEEDEAA